MSPCITQVRRVLKVVNDKVYGLGHASKGCPQCPYKGLEVPCLDQALSNSGLIVEFRKLLRVEPAKWMGSGLGLVRKAGLEPAWLAPPPPQDGVSANSTTSALNVVTRNSRSVNEPIRAATALAELEMPEGSALAV